MKISISRVVALGGVCALLAGAGTAALAQGDGYHDGGDQGQFRQNQYGQDRHGQGGDFDYRHSDQYRHASQNERRRLDHLHAAYARAAEHGNYGAAERDHEHAEAIRARLRAQHRDHGQDHGDGQFRDDHSDQHGNY